MAEYIFTEHQGDICPVPLNSYVIYRTTNRSVPRSHIHMPVKAGEINWKTSTAHCPSGAKKPLIGMVLEYAVVKQPKFKPNFQPLFTNHERVLVDELKSRRKE